MSVGQVNMKNELKIFKAISTYLFTSELQDFIQNLNRQPPYKLNYFSLNIPGVYKKD